MDWDAIVEQNNRGTAYLKHGRHSAAVRCLLRAAAACGPLSDCRSNLLVSLLYHPQLSPEQIAELHEYRGGPVPERIVTTAHRRLRVAYLTPDFHFHPKAFLHIPHLVHYDRRRFELFIYSSNPRPDRYTRQARAAADHWRNVANQPSDRVAQYIRSDQIDILLDITGHFSRSPLAVFALRPAPLQISIPGYPATTGLHAVDYKFVDRQTDPVGMTEHLYTEKLFRLRRPIACYAPPADSPAVTRLPARTNGFITFGSFNNRPKINGPLMSLWSRILQQIPGSRLLFHHTFNGYREVSRDFRDPIARYFRGQGVSGRRLEFIGALPIQEHLAAIAQADIALDSFPYNGLTTTCECLWMGVPVLTLAGRTHASRTGVSLLTGLGLEDWVTRSPDEYVRCAAAKARRVDALDRLREGLRTQMGQSSLVDGAGMIRALEDSFAKIWTRLAAPIPAPERRHASL